MSLILALSPTNTLIAELPSSNGTRRKVNLSPNKLSQTAIANAIECLRSISNISISKPKPIDQNKVTDLSPNQITEILNDAVDQNSRILSELQNKIQQATECANALTTILKEDNTALDTIYRILEAQLTKNVKIGEDGNPTDQQIYHWEKHADIWGDPMCPFCRAEGKFEPGKNRERAIRNLSENEALKLGLIYRGFKQSTTNPDIWNKKNMAAVRLLPNSKIFDSKNVQWSKPQHNALVADGKLHALNINFAPQEFKPHKLSGGAVVRKLVKRATNPTTPQPKINTHNLVANF